MILLLGMLASLGCSEMAFSQDTGTVRAQGQDVDLSRDDAAQDDDGAGGGKQVREPRQEMRKLIRDISKYSRQFKQNFVVMTQGGLDLLEKIDAVDSTRKSPANTFIRSLDGIVVPGLNYHPPLPGKTETSVNRKIRESLVLLTDLGKSRGLTIWVTDYAESIKAAEESIKINRSKGYVPFAAFGPGFLFNKIPTFPRRPIDENPGNIIGIKSVKNFLYLTDSSGYDRQENFVRALSNTNFDAIIVDVFHRGRKAFRKNSVRSMKFKKLGAQRLVLAYMNIGQADSFRYYWKDNWREGNPSFISSPALGNPDRYFVKYWHPDWKNIMTGNPNSYIFGIMAQGFDGVVLDGIDAFKFFEGG